MFINTHDTSAQAWVGAISRLISGIMRTTPNWDFVIEQLTRTVDGQGFYHKGKFFNSVPAAIGYLLERCVKGEIENPFPTQDPVNDAVSSLVSQYEVGAGPASCSRCGSFDLSRSGGCVLCGSCGYSTC